VTALCHRDLYDLREGEVESERHRVTEEDSYGGRGIVATLQGHNPADVTWLFLVLRLRGRALDIPVTLDKNLAHERPRC
jgi:hypothetical protein